MDKRVDAKDLPEASNFIEQYINEDIKSGKFEASGNKIVVRFPPEPNGYLHIGHIKAMCINFGVRDKYRGEINLRMDDTNPSKEDYEYVDSIVDAVRWLGFSYDRLVFASDHYDDLYRIAEKYIVDGNAYVDELSSDEVNESRGTLTEPGRNSPYRDRPAEESLRLFREMKEGIHPDGSMSLRAKIDMASPNINMRDPVLYRIAHVSHYRTGDKWCIYPMYDFAHPLSDALEGVTHSLCSLEFENHRPLYDWIIEKAGFPEPRPRQIEFARLNITNTLMSKRYLKKLVDEGTVRGWDDPRMPTVAGLRARGVPPEALVKFCKDVGVAKAYSVVDEAQLRSCIRENLNENAERAMAVLNPLKLTITNYAGEEELEFERNPVKCVGTRKIKFTGQVYIDKGDFSLDPPKGYKRLTLGGTVRLKGAYIVRCDDVLKDAEGNACELLCTYFPETKSGANLPSDIKAKGVVQWVDRRYGREAEFRKYKPLLRDEEYPDQDYSKRLRGDSETILCGFVEPYLDENTGSFQLLREGYYKRLEGEPVFIETVSLKDGYAG